MIDLKILLTKIITTLGNKVSKSGDTMYGDLTIAKPNGVSTWSESRITCTTQTGGSGRLAAVENTGRFGLWDIKHNKWIIYSDNNGDVVIPSITQTLLYNTKTTAPSTQNTYTYASVPALANWDTIVIRAEVNNIRQLLTFCRNFENSPVYVVDMGGTNHQTYIRGGFVVDWANNRIGVRWVDGTSSYADAIYFQQVYGIL